MGFHLLPSFHVLQPSLVAWTPCSVAPLPLPSQLQGVNEPVSRHPSKSQQASVVKDRQASRSLTPKVGWLRQSTGGQQEVVDTCRYSLFLTFI